MNGLVEGARRRFAEVQAWSLRRDEQPTHDTATAGWLGISLGVSFTICFITGLISHELQHRPSWFWWPTHPAGLYRINQGLHVATGVIAVPLLLAKLWAVGHHLVRPPKRSIAEIVEWLALVPLVGGALFLLVTGVQNVDYWYAWGFFFPAAHYAAAWITIGALVVHIGAKAAPARKALRHPDGTSALQLPVAKRERRRFLAFVGGGAGVLTLFTVGRTWSPLGRVTLLSPRRPGDGSQGVPVNKSAVGTGTDRIDPVSWRLRVHGRGVAEKAFTIAEIQALPQHTVHLPISCVEGWSQAATWRGVRIRDVLAAAGVKQARALTVRSPDQGLYGHSDLTRDEVAASNALFALEINGERLNRDHGFPLRLIGPNRPGVSQTKWLTEVEVR